MLHLANDPASLPLQRFLLACLSAPVSYPAITPTDLVPGSVRFEVEVRVPGAGPLRPLVVARRGQVGDAAVRRIDEVILHEMYHVSPASRRCTARVPRPERGGGVPALAAGVARRRTRIRSPLRWRSWVSVRRAADRLERIAGVQAGSDVCTLGLVRGAQLCGSGRGRPPSGAGCSGAKVDHWAHADPESGSIEARGRRARSFRFQRRSHPLAELERRGEDDAWIWLRHPVSWL